MAEHDVVARATIDVTSTGGRASALVSVRAASVMGAMETSANRSDVSSYRMDRGRFVVGDPLIMVSASFYGVGSAGPDASWRSVCDGESLVFDAGDAGAVWPSVCSPYGELRLPPDAVDHIVDSASGAPGSARRYRAARMSAGWRTALPIGGSAEGWSVVAAKCPPGASGELLSMVCGGTVIGIGIEGGRFRVLLGGGTQVLRPRPISSASPIVVGIAATPYGAQARIGDGSRTTLHEWTTSAETVVSRSVAGGTNSPDLLLYAIACGTGGGFGEMMDAMTGYLAC